MEKDEAGEGKMLYGVGIVAVGFGVTAMSLHKLAERPILEIMCWGITFGCFLWFQVLLHR